MTAPARGAIEEHPDLRELQVRHARHERATRNPLAQLVEGVSILAGLYLAASPWINGFYNNFPSLTVVNLITGLAFALLATGIGSSYERTHGMSWAALGLGAWTILSPWVTAGNVDSRESVISNVITGGAMVLLALLTALMALRGVARGSGRAQQGTPQRTAQRPATGTEER